MERSSQGSRPLHPQPVHAPGTATEGFPKIAGGGPVHRRMAEQTGGTLDFSRLPQNRFTESPTQFEGQKSLECFGLGPRFEIGLGPEAACRERAQRLNQQAQTRMLVLTLSLALSGVQLWLHLARLLPTSWLYPPHSVEQHSCLQLTSSSKKVCRTEEMSEYGELVEANSTNIG